MGESLTRMSDDDRLAVLPYAAIVGHENLKLALEIAFVSPAVQGVLVSGQRGTAKSTAVRAFCRMVYGDLPVTLPINATEDRVLGGWNIDALMRSRAEIVPGLLEEAGERGLLYVDEVNLLDDYLVNVILDVASTGYLTVQREMLDQRLRLSFTLVGTMNPEEGGLRPQLLDRFGLMVVVDALPDREQRRKVLEAVLAFDEARRTADTPWLQGRLEEDERRRAELHAARKRVGEIDFGREVASLCADIASAFQAAGQRGEYVTAFAARAKAALDGASTVEADHVAVVAPMALIHRTPAGVNGGTAVWTADDDAKLRELVERA